MQAYGSDDRFGLVTLIGIISRYDWLRTDGRSTHLSELLLKVLDRLSNGKKIKKERTVSYDGLCHINNA